MESKTITTKGLKKLALLLVIPLFLMVGGAAAFFFVLSTTTDPAVEQDISDHFAQFEHTSALNAQVDIFDFPQHSHPEYTLTSVAEDAATGNGFPHNPHKPKVNQTEKQPARANKKKNTNRDFSPRTPKPGIAEIAPGTYLIQQQALENAKQHLKKFLKNARAELVENDKGPVGFRITGISKSSHIHAIGIRNKDVLVGINGHPLNSIENVSLAVAGFQNATQFRLDLVRRNKKRSLYYKVVA